MGPLTQSFALQALMGSPGHPDPLGKVSLGKVWEQSVLGPQCMTSTMSGHVVVIKNYTCTSNLVQSGPAQTGGRTDRQEQQKTTTKEDTR